MAEHETIADIIAQLRKQAKLEHKAADRLQKRGNDMDYGIGCNVEEDANYLDSIADSLEAAIKREKATAEKSSVAGDHAKLREALSKFCAYSSVVLNTGMFNRVHLEALLNMAKAALASPPRICDVYTADELKVIFNSELVLELPIANEHEKNLVTITAMGVIDTLFATTKEGVAK